MRRTLLRIPSLRFFSLAALLALVLALSLGSSALARVSSTPGSVEQPQLRNATTTVYKLPDGNYQAEIHSTPIHYQDSSGAWQDIDATLAASTAPGVAYQNRAAGFGLQFAVSAASNQLVSLSTANESISFGLAGASPLSRPIALGDTVTYGEVIPNVDLTFQSLPTGLKESLTLKTRPSGPMSFGFPISLVGLTVAQQPDGSLTLVREGGKAPFVIPAPFMSDAAGVTPQISGKVTLAPSTKGGKLVFTLTPDLAWLQDPARVYPVTIDPTVTLSSSANTYVVSNSSTPIGSATQLQSGSANGGATIARALAGFDTSSIAGKHILSANLSAWESASYSCTASPVSVYRVTSSWTLASVIWSNQPTIDSTALSTISTAKGFSSSCPAGIVSFGSITSTAADWASGAQPNWGLELRAGNESDSNGWKRFAAGFQIAVTYNSVPAVPSNLSPASGSASSSTTPTLLGTFNDADSNAIGHFEFEVYRRSDSALVASGNGNNATPAHISSWTVPSGALAPGNAYYWRARATDGTDVSKWVASLAYTATAPCPGNPPQSTSAPAVSSSAGSGAPVGATLSATTGFWNGCGSTVSDYWYQWFRSDGNSFFLIPDATEPSYTVTSDDFGLRLYPEVTADSASGTSAPARSSNTFFGGSDTSDPPSVPNCAPLPPSIRTYPALTGPPQVGQTLTTSNGVWFSCGSSISGYTYQWFRDNSPIVGATLGSYFLTSADLGHNVKAQVTAYNAEGPSSPADSNIVLIGSGGSSNPECSDGVDNDSDSKIDYPADPGCTGPSDDTELDGATGSVTWTACGQLLSNPTFCWLEPPPENPAPVNFGGYVLGWHAPVSPNVQGVRSGIRAPTDNDFSLLRTSVGWERVAVETADSSYQLGFGRTTAIMQVGTCYSSPQDKKLHVFWESVNGNIADPSNREQCSWFPSLLPALSRGSSHVYSVYHKLGPGSLWQANFDGRGLKAVPAGFNSGTLAIAGGEIQGSGFGEVYGGPDGDVRGCYGCAASPLGVLGWQWTSTAGSSGWAPVALGNAAVISPGVGIPNSHDWFIDPGPLSGSFYVRHYCHGTTYGGCGY